MTAAAARLHMHPPAPPEAAGTVRLCRNWLGQTGRPASAPAVRLQAVLAEFRCGRQERLGELLDLAAADPRLLGEVADAILDWMREAGTLKSNPRLALEMMNMRRLFREAVAERETPPDPTRLKDAAEADGSTTGTRDLVATALSGMAERFRGIWLLERRCAILPRWRHWDILLEVRPGILLGEPDVPERVAVLMQEVRCRLAQLWLEDGTLAVHAYPVHASRALLNHMRERGLVIHSADAGGNEPVATRPSPCNDDKGGARVPQTAGESLPALRGSPAEDDRNSQDGMPDTETGTEERCVTADGKTGGRKELFETWLAPLQAHLPMPVADLLRQGRRHAMLMGLSLLPAFIAWQMLMPDPTRSRIAAFEESYAQLVAARPWRREEGADEFDPLKTLDAYRGALGDFDATPSLPIYTDETRRFLLGRFRSRLGMEQEWQALFECSDPRISFRGDLAVVQFMEVKAACAPFFFRKEGGRWRLDMKARTFLIAEAPDGTWQWRAGVLPDLWRFAFAPLLEGEYEPGP